MISAEQCRGARAMLGWSQVQLAEAAAVSRATINDFERGARAPQRNSLVSIQRAFEMSGIVFIEENGGGAGLRFEKPTTKD